MKKTLKGFDYLSMSIGYDGKAYFLFSSKIPDRIDGMFVNTVANAEYTALVVTPSWESGELKKVERINFGRHVMNFRFLRPVPDGSFLLLGSRCMYSKKNGPEKNAVFIDREGNVLRAFTFGDGIADCIVRDDGLIWKLRLGRPHRQLRPVWVDNGWKEHLALRKRYIGLLCHEYRCGRKSVVLLLH